MSKAHIERLIEERQKTWKDAQSLLDAVTADGRSVNDMSAEERSQWDRMNADLDSRAADIDMLLNAEERASQADELRARAETLFNPRGQSKAVLSENEELRAIAMGERPQGVNFTTGYFPTVAETRALSEGTATAGGNTVDRTFVNSLWANLVWSSQILRMEPTILRTSRGDNLIQPTAATGTNVTTITAEAGAISESNPTFNQVTLSAYKYAVLVKVSNELVTDTAVDLVGWVSRESARQISDGFGSHLYSGTGTGQPQGIKNVSAGPAAAAVSPDALFDLAYSVGPQYRQNGKYLVSDPALATLRKAKASTAGTYLWEPSTQAGQPDSFNGFGVYSDPNMPAATTGNEWALFGDFSRAFLVRIVGDVQVASSEHVNFASDQMTYRVALRADSKIVDTGAVKKILVP